MTHKLYSGVDDPNLHKVFSFFLTADYNMDNDTIILTSQNISLSLTSLEVYKMFLVKNYSIIVLYVPVILMAITANTLVILVVVKYNFMRR